MKHLIDSNKRSYVAYFFSIPLIFIITAILYDEGKYFQIILLSSHMAYGLKLMFPFSKFKKIKAWRIDVWIYGYRLKFFFELLYTLLSLILLIKFLIPNDHPFGDNFKFFFILYFLYTIIFMTLSIDIKKQDSKPDKTFF
jgi:hypothetical protein